MAQATTALRPYRSYDEADVINGFFTFGSGVPATAGLFVKIQSGFLPDQLFSMVGNPPSYGGVTNGRWVLQSTVVPCAGSGDNPLGMLMYDVRETDEYGEKLIYHRRKAESNNWTVSGEGVNIATKGVFFWSGLSPDLSPVAGAPAYLGIDGNLNTSGTLAGSASAARVGTWLSPKTNDGWILLKLNL